ncbi:MAG: HIT domain-containing protein [Acidobacteriaceae bacterium]|nr:HIT domain-containing protein [Acidobacteriaceae bacterium]
MDHLWTPWRSTYITGQAETKGCIFCDAAGDPSKDSETLVVYRGRLNFVILNRFPYTTGHLMVAPYKHVARLTAVSADTTAEMMQITRHSEEILERTYRPDGLNLGMNLGQAAGAGIAQHIHLHMLPRWIGDANFMTTVAQTRVMPESLGDTYEKLKAAFAGRP